ncbi:hypothetical protein AB833_09520 [Chromatiales bacterium (ex Bugula neritina AB1)]|nr:hypothetical protein AB833_09520 [Chromatiales bacterium (ex Bugula neritina AB1)]
MKVGEQVKKVRSKNAGPFWITVDVFCGDDETYQQMNKLLSSARVAGLYQVPLETLKRFEMPDLSVLKFSFPRSVVQGGRFDRDMHGAQMSVLLAELDLAE